jgi:mono/diheme cytochrome c family protein
MPGRVAYPLIAAALLACAGCGGSSGRQSPAGRVVFSHACSACHTLSGIDDPRHQGGDLLRFHADRAQLIQLVREMPVRHALDPAQIRAVVGYVIGVERGAPRS